MSAETGVTISIDDYLYFADRAFSGMAKVLLDLGDDLANTRPPLPDASTPFGLVTHCLAVADDWAGHLVAGRAVERDRAGEFAASGSVSDLVADIDRARARLAADVGELDSGGAPTTEPDRELLGSDRDLDRAGVLVHLLEELCQHQGRLEVLRDVLVAWTRLVRRRRRSMHSSHLCRGYGTSVA